MRVERCPHRELDVILITERRRLSQSKSGAGGGGELR